MWRFVCEFAIAHTKGLVKQFVAGHAREPIDTVCYFPVLLLTVSDEIELHGVRIRPRDSAGEDDEPGSMTAVPVRGTNYKLMAERARPVAEHALRVLRACLRDYNFMPDEQLRFRLGYSMRFEDCAGGWSNPPGQGWELGLDDELLKTARAAPLYELPLEATNDVERRTNTALGWFEQAQLVGDPLMEVLFCFMALEAILGDTREGLKGPKLALRRAMLSLLTKDGFRHPSTTFVLYDEVRNAAIHGEARPDISAEDANRFAWDVRRALNEFLEYARKENLTKRSQVRKKLDEYPRRAKVQAGLLEQDAKTWSRLLQPDDEPSCSR